MTFSSGSQVLPDTTVAISDCAASDVPSVVALLDAIWGATNGSGPVNEAMLHTLRQTGAYVRLAAGPDGRPKGALIAFRATHPSQLLHLHVVGVASEARGLGIGELLMRDVGRWALESQFNAIEWTFDPLVARNAHLYLGVLGARPVAYLTDAYGQINDGINSGQGSDRLLVEWVLSDPDTARSRSWPTAPPLIELDAEGAPRGRGPAASLGTLAVPADIERLREASPETARRWRSVSRAVLGDPLARILGFDRERGYLVECAREVPR